MSGTITARELKAMLHDGGELALLDVREAGEFGESHLLFATPVPYSTLELEAARLVPRKSTRIVVCDEDGDGHAALAANRLQAVGYTDVAVLTGGNRGWAQAGYALFKGVNVPSKLFGELVEHACHTPRVTVQELVRMKDARENFVIVDGRPFAEYTKMNIPGGICCPNAELPYRIREIVSDPATKIIVNCAGRTRSILGAQTLINFGVANPVYALENGTQGWVLADFQLERGATRRYPERIDETHLSALQERARALMKRHAVSTVDAAAVERWLNDSTHTTVLLDVRTPEEFGAGSVPGAVHAPGGQLVQATDQWVAVRNARIVLIDGEGVRAPVVASWLKQLGCNVHVLEDGVRTPVSAPPPVKPALPEIASVSAAELKTMLERRTCAAFDLGHSMNFRKAHIPGSRWSIRSRLAVDARGAHGAVALIADDPDVARLGAIDLLEAGATDVRRLDGGLAAWQKAGYSSEASLGVPADAECIDYLFFVHDRHAGNREAMKQYFAWETGLLAQLDEQDRASFKMCRPGTDVMTGAPRAEVVVKNGVATLTLIGEKSVNVMGRALIASLVRALEALRQDATLRLLIVSGPPGGSFQGGVNIAEMAGFTPDAARDFITLLHQACHGLRALPVPSIARIEGYCLGGGMELAASCDLRIGSDRSRYGMPEVQVGLPSVIEARLLPTLIGWGYTRELLYRGNVLDAAEAHRIGFLQKLAPDGGMDAGLAAWIEDILRAEPGAIRAQKRLIENWLETAPAAGIQASIDAFSATFHTDAPNQRLQAFLNRPRKK